MKTLTLKSAVTLVAVIGALAVASSGVVSAFQTTQPATDTMSRLLSEVHALRVAMEQSATVGPRMQLTLARLNMQEQRTVLLYNQLTQIRNELNATMRQLQESSDELAETQKKLITAADDKKPQLQQIEAALKMQMTQATSREQQLRSRESETAQALRTEQDRWTELNERLDEMERLLGPNPRQ